MSIEWLGSAAIAIVTGGAAGYVSSVFAAGPVARRQAAAQQRIAAEQAITQVVSEYLGRISAYKLNPQFIYPEGYAAIAGREALAEAVLTQLPALKRGPATLIRMLTGQLAGSRTMETAKLRAGVPADARMDADTLAGQHGVIEREIRLGYHRGVGCKQELYRFCPDEHYPEVLDDYGLLGLLWLVQGHPHSVIRPAVQAGAIAQLEAIIDQVQPGRVKARQLDEMEARVRANLGLRPRDAKPAS